MISKYLSIATGLIVSLSLSLSACNPHSTGSETAAKSSGMAVGNAVAVGLFVMSTSNASRQIAGSGGGGGGVAIKSETDNGPYVRCLPWKAEGADNMDSATPQGCRGLCKDKICVKHMETFVGVDQKNYLCLNGKAMPMYAEKCKMPDGELHPVGYKFVQDKSGAPDYGDIYTCEKSGKAERTGTTCQWVNHDGSPMN